MPTTSHVIKVASDSMFHAPGIWAWFKAARNEPLSWKRQFLHALTAGRATDADIDALVAGHYSATTEGDTLVLSITRAAS